MSSPVFDEIVEVLHRPKFKTMISPARLRDVLDVLRASVTWTDADVQVTDCRDDKDNKYLELALAAKAAAIISGDADLLVLDPWRQVRLLTPVAFLSWIAAGGAAASNRTR